MPICVSEDRGTAGKEAGPRQPVVILLGWGGCRDKNLAKYSAIYHTRVSTARTLGSPFHSFGFWLHPAHPRSPYSSSLPGSGQEWEATGRKASCALLPRTPFTAQPHTMPNVMGEALGQIQFWVCCLPIWRGWPCGFTCPQGVPRLSQSHSWGWACCAVASTE